MKLREAKRAETEERILTAARKLLLEQGSPGVAMTEIAVAAGVSRATLFNYFSGKSALLQAMAAEFDSRFARTVSHYRDREESAPAALEALFARAALVLEQTAGLTRVLVMESGGGEGFPKLMAEFEALVQAGQASGQWRGDLPAARLAESLYAAFVTSLLGWCRQPRHSLADEFAERARDLGRLLARAA